MLMADNPASVPYSHHARAWEIAARAPDCHPFEVGAQVLLDGGDAEYDFIVALLHDSIEDGYATRDEIVDTFGTIFSGAVWELTRRGGEVYADYIERVAASTPIVRRVKLADIYVNLQRSQRAGDTSRVKRYQRAFNRLAPVAYGV